MIRSPRARENQDIKTEQNLSFYTRQKWRKIKSYNHNIQKSKQEEKTPWTPKITSAKGKSNISRGKYNPYESIKR